MTALRSFEAAARTGSMTAAAKELCVTHGAVSRQVQLLESELGVILLYRLPRQLKLTGEGARLADALAVAFAKIEEGVLTVKPGPIVLSCSSSLTMRWLIPRLAMFKDEYPGISLQLEASYGPIEPNGAHIDIALRNNVLKPPAGIRVEDVAEEWIGPVCTPAYLTANPVNSVTDLLSQRRLVTQTRADAWDEWLTIVDAVKAAAAAADVESYEHFYLMLQAVACGLGVAVAPHILIADDLRAGALVAPFGFVRGRRSLQLWTNERGQSRHDVRNLAKWLKEQILNTSAAE